MSSGTSLIQPGVNLNLSYRPDLTPIQRPALQVIRRQYFNGGGLSDQECNQAAVGHRVT